METRANYALVGMFTLAIFAAMFGFAIWFAGVRGNGQGIEYRIVFSGSVSGLSRGASVLFNGLRVGEVREISLLPEDPRRVIAIIGVDPLTPMRSDTRARLEYQGLTGIAAIQLSGGEPGTQPLQPGPNRERPTVFADRSDFQDIVETVQRLSRRVDDVINRAERMFADNEASVSRTVRNIETFTQSLATHSEGIGAFLSATTSAGERIAALATKLDSFTTELDGLVRAIEPHRVAKIIGNIEGFSEIIGQNRTELDTTIKNISNFANRINKTASSLDGVFVDFSSLLKALDPVLLSRSLQNIDQVTTTIGRNNEQIDKTLKSAATISDNLSAASARMDSVLAAAERFLGTGPNGEMKGMLTDVAAAARALRILADNFDKRSVDVMNGLKRLTGPGLRDLEALTSDGRRTMQDIGRTVRSIEKDPSQILFGGQSKLPEYDGKK